MFKPVTKSVEIRSDSANIDEIDPEVAAANIVRERIDNAEINLAISNSFGFGGTNATLALQRYNG